MTTTPKLKTSVGTLEAFVSALPFEDSHASHVEHRQAAFALFPNVWSGYSGYPHGRGEAPYYVPVFRIYYAGPIKEPLILDSTVRAGLHNSDSLQSHCIHVLQFRLQELSLVSSRSPARVQTWKTL